MSREANYSEFQTLPSSWTRAVWSEHDSNGNHTLLNESDPFKWSGAGLPPPVGCRVTVYMNSLGAGSVVGYFVEYGWLGVLVQLDKNPRWRKEQLKRDGKAANPPAHCFGLDLERRKPINITRAAAARKVLDGSW